MKVCHVCGKLVLDENAFCGYCGNQINEPMSNYENSSDDKLKRKIKIRIVVLVLFAIGCLVAVSVLNFYKPYKKPIEQVVKLINMKENNDYILYKCFMLDSQVDWYRERTKAYDDYGDELMPYAIEWFENQFGTDYKIDVKVISAEKLDEYDLDDYQDYYDELYEKYENNKIDTINNYEEAASKGVISNYDANELKNAYRNLIEEYDDVSVEAGYEVDLQFEITGDKDVAFKLKNVFVIRINNKWYIADCDLKEFINAIAKKASDELE